jgi:hypothetical protein
MYITHIVSLMESHEKPVLGVSMLKDDKDRTVYSINDHKYKAVVYPTPEQAVVSLAKMCEYCRVVKR